MKTKMLMLILICILNTNTYSWDEVQYFDNKPNQNVIDSFKDKEYDRRDSDHKDRRDSDHKDRRDSDHKDRRDSDYKDRRDSDYNDRRDSDYKDRRDSDYNDRRDSEYKDYSDYKDRRDSDYNDYSDYKDRRDSEYNDRRDRDSDYNNHYDTDRRDRDYREYDDRRDKVYRDHRDYRRYDDRRERDKEKIIWEEVSKEDSIDGYKAFLKTFPNSYYANLAKYKIEKLTTYGEIDAKSLEAYKNIPYWVTNGELEDKSEQCAVASIDLNRDDQIKSLMEVEKQAKDKLSSNYYLLSTDIIKTNFYTLDKKIYALAYVYNNKKAERNKKMFYKRH